MWGLWVSGQKDTFKDTHPVSFFWVWMDVSQGCFGCLCFLIQSNKLVQWRCFRCQERHIIIIHHVFFHFSSCYIILLCYVFACHFCGRLEECKRCCYIIIWWQWSQRIMQSFSIMTFCVCTSQVYDILMQSLVNEALINHSEWSSLSAPAIHL